MNFLLIGCNGNMGRQVAEVVSQQKCDKIIAGIDTKKSENHLDFPVYLNTKKVNKKIDAIIDFSTCNNRQEYISFALKHNIPYACFSTICSSEDITLFENLAKSCPVLICKNTSIGVNLLYKLIDIACQYLPNADVAVNEYHHTLKKDMPSGTAKNIENILSKSNIKFTTSSFRVGTEKGTHSVQFFLEDEIIEINHRANSRKIFALGALNLVHKLPNQPNGIYNYL